MFAKCEHIKLLQIYYRGLKIRVNKKHLHTTHARQTDSLFRLIHTVHRLNTNCITKYVTCIYIFAK